jgi:transposase-like protein
MKTPYTDEFKQQVLDHFQQTQNKKETIEIFGVSRPALNKWLNPEKYKQRFDERREMVYAQRREQYANETKDKPKKGHRKPYSEEFKQQVLEYHKEHGFTKTVKHFDISKLALTTWLNPEKYEKYFREMNQKEEYKSRQKNYEQTRYQNDEAYRKRRLLNNKAARRRYFAKHGVDMPSQYWRYTFDYLTWQQSVFERDNHTCQHCNKTNCKVHAHHIKHAADFPELRFVIENGLTLCPKCHKKEHRRLN